MRIICASLVLMVNCSVAFADGLRVGAAAVDITPAEGTPLAGYYEPRGSKRVLDPLYSKAMVLEQDGAMAALVVCDLISLPRHIVVEARRLIEKQTGIPAANVMLSATHTHTGPVLERESARDGLDGASSDLGRRYTAALPSLIARGVAEAKARLRPALASAAKGKEDQLAFNRRFIMKDGSVSWNPKKQHPDIVRPAGPIDPEVGILAFADPKGQTFAIYVNYAMHPDTVGGEGISADYPGVLARAMNSCFGADCFTLFANGCCGNLNHRNIGWPDSQKGPRESFRLGTILAGAVCRALPELRLVSTGPLRCRHEMVDLDLPMLTEADVQWAREVQARIRQPKTTFMEKVRALQILDVECRKGKPWQVEVQVITLGDHIAWVSLPGEIFVELGLSLKKHSPHALTMIAELANGSIGYIPDAAAYPQGNYEVVSARCAAGSGEKLVEAAVRLLKAR